MPSNYDNCRWLGVSDSEHLQRILDQRAKTSVHHGNVNEGGAEGELPRSTLYQSCQYGWLNPDKANPWSKSCRSPQVLGSSAREQLKTSRPVMQTLCGQSGPSITSWHVTCRQIVMEKSL